MRNHLNIAHTSVGKNHLMIDCRDSKVSMKLDIVLLMLVIVVEFDGARTIMNIDVVLLDNVLSFF